MSSGCVMWWWFLKFSQPDNVMWAFSYTAPEVKNNLINKCVLKLSEEFTNLVDIAQSTTIVESTGEI